MTQIIVAPGLAGAPSLGHDEPVDRFRGKERTALGDHFQTIVDVEAAAEDADVLADKVLTSLVETGFLPSLDCVTRNEISTEGLVVVTSRRVFCSMTGEDEITYPHRGHVESPEDDMFETIGRWWFDGGSGERPCPDCGRRVGSSRRRSPASSATDSGTPYSKL